MAIHYRCKHCNHWPLDHKANTQHCPLGKLRNSQFNPTQVYEADPKKPSKEKIKSPYKGSYNETEGASEEDYS